MFHYFNIMLYTHTDIFLAMPWWMNRLYTVMEYASFMEFEPHHRTFFIISFIFYLFIYWYNCLNIIYNQLQIILAAEYHLNGSKQSIPY